MRKPEPWDDTWKKMCQLIAERSKDPAFQAGALIVTRDNRIISAGYNGPSRNVDDNDVPFDMRPDKYAWIIHAEHNAILHALEANFNLAGCFMFVNCRPCANCVSLATHFSVYRIFYNANNVPKVCDEENWKLAQRIAESSSVTELHPW